MNSVSAVKVRHEGKNVDRVTGPCAVSIPVRIVSRGHYDNSECLVGKVNVELNAEGEYTEGLVGAVPTGKSSCSILIVGGKVEHVLRLCCAFACKYVVLSVLSNDRYIAVLGEDIVSLRAVVNECLLGSEGVITSSTLIGYYTVKYGSNGSVVSNSLALGLAASVLTSGRSVTGSGSHLMSGRINSLSFSGAFSTANGTVGNEVVRTCNLTLRSYTVLFYCCAGNTGSKLAGGSTTVLTGCENLTGSICIVVSERLGRGVSALVESYAVPMLATCCISRHLVTKLGAFLNASILNAATYKKSTGSSLGTVVFTGCIVVVGVFAENVLKLSKLGMYGRNDTVTDEASYNSVISAGSLTRGLYSVLFASIHRNVVESGNFFLSNKCLSADGALLTFGETGRGTSCIYSLKSLLGVTEFRNFSLSYDSLATNGALLTFGETGFGTSCILTGNYFLGVVQHRNYFLSNKCLSANGALLAFGKTGSSTGGILTGNYFLGVAESCALGCATNGTGLRSGTGGIRPSMAFCFALCSAASFTSLRIGASCIVPIVTESCAIGLAASLTSLGSSAICSCPIVTKSFTLSLLASLTSLGSGTSSLSPIMAESRALNFTTCSTSLRCFTCSFSPFMLVLGLRVLRGAEDNATRRECE